MSKKLTIFLTSMLIIFLGLSQAQAVQLPGGVWNSAGNIGIGTTNPSEALNIGSGGNLLIDGTGNGKIYLGHGIRGVGRAELMLLANGLETPSEIEFGYDARTDDNVRWTISDRGASAGLLTFYEGPALSGGWAQRVTLKKGGNVGIGTTNPGASLDVAGSNGFINAYSTQLCALGGAGDAVIMTDNHGNLFSTSTASFAAANTLWSGTRNGSIWNGDAGVGKVGIGTTAPDTKLDISGSTANRLGNIKHYRNVVHYNAVSTVTGTMKITMPKSWSNTMMKVIIQGYNYNYGAWEVIVSGYNYSTNTGWYNYSAEINGRAPFSTVRLAHDGTKNVILLGNTSTSWYYPQIVVSDVIAGYQQITGWGSGWSIAPITDEAGISYVKTPTIYTFTNTAGNVGIGTVSPAYKLHVAGDIYANGGWLRASGTKGLYFQSYGGGWYMSDTSWIRSYGSKYVRAPYFYSDTIGAYCTAGSGTANYLTKFTGTYKQGNSVIYDNGTNVGIGTTAPSKKLYVYGDSYASGNSYGGSSMRSPIFYDLNNTGYYLNPASTSNLNAVNFAGKIITSGTHRRAGVYGTYDSQKIDTVWSMGSGYQIADDGSTFGNLYGMSYCHTNNAHCKAGLGHQIEFTNNGVVGTAIGFNGGIWTNGNVTAAEFIYSSDRELKKNIKPLTNSLDKILKLQGVSFNWKKNNQAQLGLIAQDVQKIYPELVKGEEGSMGVQYGNLVAPLIEAVKEQEKEIRDLRNVNNSQEIQIKNLLNKSNTLQKEIKDLQKKD